MSTSETFTYEKDACPCGAGKILQHVDSPDNPWSRTSISYQITCPRCSAEWKASDGYLSSVEDEKWRDDAFKALLSSQDALRRAAEHMLNRHFEGLGLKSMAAEHRYLQSRSISWDDLIRFRKRRNAGETLSQICLPWKNEKWLLELADQYNRRSDIEPSVLEVKSANAAYQAAMGSVRTFHFAS